MHPTLAKSNMFSEDSVPTTPAAQFRPAMAAFESPDDTEAIFAPAQSRDVGPWQGLFLLAERLALEHNYLPSLHVAFATICTLAYARSASGAARVVLVVWWAAIAVSTLLTHQHYVLDVMTGIVLGWAAFNLVYQRLLQPECTRLQTSPPSQSNDLGQPA
jgi:membrane-associated phospholipid phosphatase